MLVKLIDDTGKKIRTLTGYRAWPISSRVKTFKDQLLLFCSVQPLQDVLLHFYDSSSTLPIHSKISLRCWTLVYCFLCQLHLYAESLINKILRFLLSQFNCPNNKIRKRKQKYISICRFKLCSVMIQFVGMRRIDGSTFWWASPKLELSSRDEEFSANPRIKLSESSH